MAGRRVGGAVCCAAVALALAAPAGASTFPNNRVANPEAEDGLTGWQGMGFGLAAYDSEAIPRRSDRDLGTYLFAAAAGAAMWQIIDFSGLADTIDSGRQELSGGGLLGGREGQLGGARLVIQPLDGGGAALGEAKVIGPPSDRDRQFKTLLLDCHATTITVPVGMRSVLFRVEAIGHGLADHLYVLPQQLATPAILQRPPFRPADGPGCTTVERLPDPGFPPPAPSLRSLVLMPAPNRCGRREPLRFRVHGRWRSRVASLQVIARGKRTVRSPSRPIVIAAPQRPLRVALRVRLRDGREQIGTQRFSGCRR